MSLVWASLLLSTIAAADSRQPAYPRAELLMEPVACVASNKPEFHFLDVRARKAYKASHAAGAVWVDHAAWAKDFKSSQDPDLWTMKIEELGIGGDGHAVVVIYDSKTINDAA